MVSREAFIGGISDKTLLNGAAFALCPTVCPNLGIALLNSDGSYNAVSGGRATPFSRPGRFKLPVGGLVAGVIRDDQA